MLDSLFQFFFAYRPVVFTQGELRFAAWGGSYLAIAAARRRGGRRCLVSTAQVAAKLRTRDRVVLTGLRAALVALLALCLFRPVLVVKAAVPQQNFLGVLLDDSRSMQIADQDQAPRAAFVKKEFGAPDRGVLKTLSDKFMVRTFRFSSAASRIDVEDDLTFTGAQTRSAWRSTARARSSPGCRSRGSSSISDGADTAEGGARQVAARRSSRRACRSSRSASDKRRCRATSRLAASTRRAPRSRARR